MKKTNLFHSVYFLYVLLVLAIINLLLLSIYNKEQSIILFILISCVMYLLKQNMIFVLLVPILIVNLMLLLKHLFDFKEGFSSISPELSESYRNIIKKILGSYGRGEDKFPYGGLNNNNGEPYIDLKNPKTKKNLTDSYTEMFNTIYIKQSQLYKQKKKDNLNEKLKNNTITESEKKELDNLLTNGYMELTLTEIQEVYKNSNYQLYYLVDDIFGQDTTDVEIENMLDILNEKYKELEELKEVNKDKDNSSYKDMTLFTFIQNNINVISDPLIIQFIDNLDTDFSVEEQDTEEDEMDELL